MPFDPTQVAPKTCVYCGEPFRPTPSITKPSQWAKAQHCSISCGRRAGKQRSRPSCPDCGGWKSSSAARCKACVLGALPTKRERLMAKVNQNGPIPTHRPDLGRCWLWTGCTLENGYPQFSVDGVAVLAHRVSYDLHVGDLPDLPLDHLCRVPACVRPSHLEPVTHAENLRRGLLGVLKTHCANGHPWTAENIATNGAGRCCRICRDERNRGRAA